MRLDPHGTQIQLFIAVSSDIHFFQTNNIYFCYSYLRSKEKCEEKAVKLKNRA